MPPAKTGSPVDFQGNQNFDPEMSGTFRIIGGTGGTTWSNMQNAEEWQSVIFRTKLADEKICRDEDRKRAWILPRKKFTGRIFRRFTLLWGQGFLSGLRRGHSKGAREFFPHPHLLGPMRMDPNQYRMLGFFWASPMPPVKIRSNASFMVDFNSTQSGGWNV
jgi:hypothetical protein